MQTDNKPQNGLAGLKHWRYDLGAGLQVALVSLPLSLGIAVASGAPPITGVISAIIAGLIFHFLIVGWHHLDRDKAEAARVASSSVHTVSG